MRPRGKAIAVTTAALGLAVLVAAGIAGPNHVSDAWWIEDDAICP